MMHANSPIADAQRVANRAGRDAAPWIVRLGRAGLVARGVVFGIIGGFLVHAALRTLEQQPYGPYLLGAVALGLLAYGVYQVAKARYRPLVVH